MVTEDQREAPPGGDQGGATEGQSGSGETEDKAENKPNGQDPQGYSNEADEGDGFPTITLQALGGESLWVGWREESRTDKNGKVTSTKVPYNPKTGAKAKSDDLKTWGNGTEAWSWAQAQQAKHPTVLSGVGFEFSPLRIGGADCHSGGIDLDTCRDLKTGAIEPWAMEVITRFESYAEISPSGTGVKIWFLYLVEDIPDINEMFGHETDKDGKKIFKLGRQFKRAGGEHPPAIEVYRDNRYFAYTGLQLQGVPAEMCLVSTEIIRWVIEEAGPNFKKGRDSSVKVNKTARSGGGDDSRSAKAFREGARLKRHGCTYEEMRDGLVNHDDAEIRAWCEEKGSRNNERELLRIFDKARGGRAGNKPRILWTGETDDEACNLAEENLLQAGGLYERLGMIVGVARARGRTREGDIICYPSLRERGDYGLRRDLARCVQFETENDMCQIVPCHPPMDLIRMLKHEGQTRFPVIAGLIHTPTLRFDESILQTPGFDEQTGLLFDPKGVDFLPVADKPTKEQAGAALALINNVLREFPYDRLKDHPTPSRSVALACILTAVVRQAFLFAPGFAFDAPVPRSGKGKTVNIAHIIAFGHRAVVENWTTNDEENEKMLGTILIAGSGALAIDNVEHPLGGGLISKVLTEPKLSVRILGKSEKIDAEPIMLVTITGNNLRFKNDITARLLKSRIDAGMESPEDRQFNWDAVVYAMEHRVELVHAVLTILRAYIVHVQDGGARAECPQWGDYVDWSRFVREPLLWLGEPDPVVTNKTIKNEDPEKEKTYSVYKAMFDAFPDHISRPVKEIIKYSNLIENAELRSALMSIGGSRSGDNIDAGKLGGWFGHNVDVTIGQLTLRKESGENHSSAQWFIENFNGPQVQADAHVKDKRLFDSAPSSPAGPCQGRGSTFADLVAMPIGGASNPFIPRKGQT